MATGPSPEPPLFANLYDLFVFDLDGTLAQTREDLAASVNHALERLGLPPRDLESVTRFIGNGASVLLQRALGSESTADLVEKGLRIFLDHYEIHCLDRTRLFEGADEVTASLVRAGKKLTVLTNKPTSMSQKILEGLEISDRFVRIDGGDRYPRKKPDPAGLREVMAHLGASPERTLMVGDSAVDVATARAAGIDAAGALWGFKPEEFDLDPPDYLLTGLRDLLGPAVRNPSPRSHGVGTDGRKGKKLNTEDTEHTEKETEK